MLQDDIVKNLEIETLQAATDVGAVDDTWVNAGDPIRMTMDNRLILFYDLVVNDSTGCQVRFLVSKTESGTLYEAYNAALDTWALGASDESKWLQFNAEAFMWIQVQTKATVVDSGGGTIGTIAIDFARVRV
jgi:hypothetical protein